MPRAKQLSLWLEDRPGMLGEIASALGEKKTNIVAIMAATEGGRGAVRMVVDKPAAAKKLFAARGWQTTEEEVVQVTLADSPGSLGKLASKLGKALRVAFDDLPLPSHEGRTGGHRIACLGDCRDPLLAAQRVGAVQQPAAERFDGRLSARTAAHGFQEVLLEELHASVEQVLLGGEVIEDRDFGNLCGAGNLRHRHVLERALCEESAGCVEDRFPGLLLLALPEPDLCGHPSSLAGITLAAIRFKSL